MKRVLVVGKIMQGRVPDQHPSVARVIDIRATDQFGWVLHSRYVIPDRLKDVRAVTSFQIRSVLHEIADIREEEFK